MVSMLEEKSNSLMKVIRTEVTESVDYQVKQAMRVPNLIGENCPFNNFSGYI